ncbi:MAG: glycosyltransferase [Pseudomonadales bacterium]|nr:glycosyltransferase [Pseudomonadales bacterium]
MKKDIVIVVPGLNQGGSERAGVNLANKLSRFYDVAIIPINHTETAYPIFDNVYLAPAVSTPEKGFISRNIHLLTTLQKTLRQFQANIIITFTGRSSVYSFITAKLLNIDCIISSERCNPTLEEESRLWLRIINFVYKHSTHLVLQTNEIKALYPGFNNLNVVANTSAIEQHYRCSQYNNHFIYIGRLIHRKNLHGLLEAYHSYASKKDSPWPLRIIGEGPALESLKQMISSLNLQHIVTLEGPNNSVETILQQGGVFVFNSLFEGFPNSIVEALSMGLPIISRNCNYGPSDMIDDGINGYLVETNEALTEALEKITSLDKKALISMGGKSREIYCNHFSESIILEQWLSLIKNSIASYEGMMEQSKIQQ